MRIGIDLDGVLFDTERYFRFYSDIYDLLHYGDNNIIDNKAVNFQDRYNWPEKVKKDFYSKVVYDLEKRSGLIVGAYETILYLKSLGYKLYIVSARGIYDQLQIDITMKLLKENGLDIFDEYIFKADNKRKIIIDKQIDYMIEDNTEICKNIKDVCKVIYFKSVYSNDLLDRNVLTVHGWHEVYRHFYKLEGK